MVVLLVGLGVVTYLSPLDRSCVVDLLTDRQKDRYYLSRVTFRTFGK